MTIKITLNGLTYEKNIPTSWDQVTFGQMLAMKDCKTPTETFAALVGIDVETLKQARIKGADKVIGILSFLKETNINAGELPKEILGYKIPQNLEFEWVQVYENLKAEIDEAKEAHEAGDEFALMKKYPLFVAMFGYPHTYDTFNIEKIEELAPYFLTAPVGEVLAVGNFTLLKLTGLRLGINPLSQKRLTPWRRFKLVLIVWLRHTVSLVRWYLWKKKLDIKERSFSGGR
jgi:hypothetical protein